MNESKISLVGWGDNQVILHAAPSIVGVSFLFKNRIHAFAATPWLKGKIVVMPVTTMYQHGKGRAELAKTIRHMRKEAMQAAWDAILAQDIFLLSEAVITTYWAQHLMGGELLPSIGEIGKRYAGSYGVYLFTDTKRIGQKLRKHSVLVS